MKPSLLNLSIKLILFLCVVILAVNSFSQTSDMEQDEALRVFIDCDHCDFTFMRQNLQFVNYVRDPELAQVHVLITTERTASSGMEYRLNFIGKEGFCDQDHQLSYISIQSNTRDEERRGLTEVLKVGLLNYVIQTDKASQIKITYDAEEKGALVRNGKDPWNYWVFHVNLGGEIDSESTQNELKFTSQIYANRITDLWKFKNILKFEHEFESYEDDGETIKSDKVEIEMESDLVRSLSERWSVGLTSRFHYTTYKNIDLGIRFSPAIEYNIFPWDELDRRSFTLAYSAGIHSFQYIEETLYDKTDEFLYYESLNLQLGLVQPWGEIRTGLSGSHFFHDVSKYNINFYCNLNVRLVKGLSFYIRMKAESIHDQLYLPKGDASLEEVLLQQRQLATDYELSSSIGIRFTFGSIYNNIINRRL